MSFRRTLAVAPRGIRKADAEIRGPDAGLTVAEWGRSEYLFYEERGPWSTMAARLLSKAHGAIRLQSP